MWLSMNPLHHLGTEKVWVSETTSLSPFCYLI